MMRGLYISATGMMVQRRNMEVITNNITNVETSGYKKDNLISASFDDVLIERINDTNGYYRYGGIPEHNIVGRHSAVGPLNFGTHVDYINTDFTQGNLETTELATDLAIVGDAWFSLDTPAGPRYSRAGVMNIDADGYLCNPDGYYVVGEDGPIYIGTMDFTVDEQGNIFVGDEIIDRLNLVSFADTNALRKEGDNLYSAPAGAAEQASEYGIRQHVLENSNVDIGREMVEMMMMYRVYESNQRILTMTDETIGKAVNDIGRLR